jgi:hypothetical protein
MNPKLTRRMYEFLRENGCLWKIRFGKRVTIKWENEVLEPVWYLDTEENIQNRYTGYGDEEYI